MVTSRGRRRTFAALAAALLLDLALPATLGTVCGPECPAGSPGYGLFFFIAHVWPRYTYYFGESSLDLLAVAALRVAVVILLVALRNWCARARPDRAAPLLEPLQVQVQHQPSSNGGDGCGDESAARPLLGHLAGSRCMLALSLLSCAYGCAKGFTRMLQAGEPAAGLLPAEGTTPPPLYFWLCVVGGAALADVERRCFLRLSPAPTPAEKAAAPASDAGVGAGEKAAEAAAEGRRRYVESTEPKETRPVAYILRLMRPDWHLLLLAYSSLIVAAAGDATVPLLYGRVIDAIAIEPDASKFRSNMLALIGVALSTGLFTGLRGSTFIVIGGRFGKRLRIELFDALLRQELDFFGATKTGDVTSRLSADCQKVSDQVQLNVNVFLRSVVQVFFTLGFMYHINAKLALACFVIVPAIVAISNVFANYMRSLSAETQDSLADANAVAEEVISAVATTRSFAAEAEEVRRYAKGMSKYVLCIVRQSRLYFFYSSLTFTFLPYCTYCLILFFAAQLIHTPVGCANPSHAPPPPPPPPRLGAYEYAPPPPQCGIDGPGLVSFVFYMQSLFSAFQQLGSIYTALAQAVGAAEKVVKWIERAPAIAPPASPLAPASCSGDIKLVDVTFRYALRPERLILDGLSLHAAPGEVLALCGPSGGGKSSIISLLEHFYTPEAGAVLLDDLPIADFDPAWFHRRVALVGQEPVLFGRSLRDNICYGLDGECRPEMEGVVSASTLANAHGFISSFEHGYETFVGERGAQLSGGQKQRVAIARALVRKPAVLLLDEATSALDAESEHVVQEAIDQMIAAGGMTVLVIAHRLSTIRNSDRILVVLRGKVSEAGTHQELLAADGEYAKLVKRQTEGAGAGNGNS